MKFVVVALFLLATIVHESDFRSIDKRAIDYAEVEELMNELDELNKGASNGGWEIDSAETYASVQTTEDITTEISEDGAGETEDSSESDEQKSTLDTLKDTFEILAHMVETDPETDSLKTAIDGAITRNIAEDGFIKEIGRIVENIDELDPDELARVVQIMDNIDLVAMNSSVMLDTMDAIVNNICDNSSAEHGEDLGEPLLIGVILNETCDCYSTPAPDNSSISINSTGSLCNCTGDLYMMTAPDDIEAIYDELQEKMDELMGELEESLNVTDSNSTISDDGDFNYYEYYYDSVPWDEWTTTEYPGEWSENYDEEMEEEEMEEEEEMSNWLEGFYDWSTAPGSYFTTTIDSTTETPTTGNITETNTTTTNNINNTTAQITSSGEEEEEEEETDASKLINLLNEISPTN